MRWIYFYFFLFCLLPFSAAAQEGTYVPLDQDIYHLIDRFHIKYSHQLPSGAESPKLHTGIQPYRRQDVAELAELVGTHASQLSPQDQFNRNYLLHDNWDYTRRESRQQGRPFLNYFFRNQADFFHAEGEEYSVRVNPVLHLQGGLDSETEGLRYINTRGVQVEGTINQRLGFYTFLTENQALFPEYVNERIRRDTIVPHEGYFKPFKQNAYDFFTARGYLNYGISKNINVQLGHDRNFIGNGYRSLILSDYAAPYFFLKLNTQFWRIQYMNLFAEMNADFEFRDQLYPKKYFAYHHLSVNITPAVNIGLFESVIFARGKGRFELQYLNPIIFYRSVEQQLGSEDNSLLGMDFKVNIAHTAQVYGQITIDEFLLSALRARNGGWENKQGLQLGAKYIDVAGISNLDLQGEFNVVRPYTYQHENRYTNYQHYQQPLAHPMGANFYEYIGILRYQPVNKLSLTGKAIYTKYSVDTDSSNYGSNVLYSYNARPYYPPNQQAEGHFIAQDNPTNLIHLDLTASWQLRHNMFIDLKQIIRHRTSSIAAYNNNAAITSLAFRWNIPQRLHEF
ncbi:MAG: hypothetical protein COW65_07510 [Cytophagales bacterium CG18_big_fil_WC_8_21_14_2_50_42_9]|nr:MAG: hypothetical protein COW65_07510 [Cytophagales bacterium CG18_big_fil_WC_8_21_14_2_50_42_9]